ncbi:hypothetical protein GGR54DRAFT_484936 [Hypoxylon sp. NC1633]|nr:hypothetical protein GGR54DRAFT_484936 [Hypoxylon sp. NC1633]
MYRRVSDAFTKYKEYSSGVRVPQPYGFIPKESLLLKLLSRMHGNELQPSDVATMERILPRPKVVRKAMIQSLTSSTEKSICIRLDFGQGDTVDMNEDQDHIIQAFMGSMVPSQDQLYLPHPKRSPRIYQAWKSAYISTSREIQNEGLQFDPEEFLDEYEECLEDFDP